jgi:hypothetical protein
MAGLVELLFMSFISWLSDGVILVDEHVGIGSEVF